MKMMNFKSNLNIEDKYGVNDVNIDKSVNFRGCIDLVKNNSVDYSDTKALKVPPLGATIVGLNNTDTPLPIKTRFYNAWTDIDAQELYLNSKPTCYLIIGKPGTGAYTLGEAMSKKLNCIHLCPRNVLLDEMEQKSPTGRCLDFNMRHNKVCKQEIIFPIIKEKIKSPAVQHRGYVMSGLPLVTTNWNDQYIMHSLNSEESILEVEDLLYDILVNLKKNKKKKDDENASTSSKGEAEGESEEEEAEEEQASEKDNTEEEEESHVELPKFLLEQCSNIISWKKTCINSKKIILMEQFKQIMNLPMRPDVIIYITCPEADAVCKKQHTFLNYGSFSVIYESIFSKIPSDLRLPAKYDMNDDYAGRQDSHIYNPKYNCRQPMNFNDNSVQQMCNFRNHLLSFIDWELEQFEPSTIIKIDGRIPIHQMMHHISERLLLLPIKPVRIPEPLYLEDPSDDLEEFWQTVEQLSIAQNNNVSFNRHASPWFNRCPVELKKRHSKRGLPKFAVSFFKHVYLMATLSSMIQFCRNPRPFLKLAYLKPTCRAIIIGTKSSGKTMNSKCLSWIFDATYIDYSTIYEQEKEKKTRNTKKNVFSEIIVKIEDSRFASWQASESQRVTNLNAWYQSTLTKLKKYVPLLVKYLSDAKCYCSDEHDDEEHDDEEHEQESRSSLNSIFLRKFEELRNDLLMLPFVNDVEQINQAIANKDTLLNEAPNNLRTPTVKPAIPVLGDIDVNEAINTYIVVNELQKNFEPTPEELMIEMFKILDSIDKKAAESTNNEEIYGKWVIDGFPTDPEFWDLLLDSDFMPDYIVALIENREIEPEILEEYKVAQSRFKNYEERFLLANDPLIKTKLLQEKPSDSKPLDIQMIVHKYVDKVLDGIFNVGQEVTPQVPDLTAFTEAIEKFREDWGNIQSKIEEANKCTIVIEHENKTDVEITEEMLLKLRQCYYLPCIPGEPEEPEDIEEDEDKPKDKLTFNLPYFLCDTNIYCPVAYYEYGVLWEGKPEFSIKYNNKLHLFSNENNLNDKFSNDVTKYQAYNIPFKRIPSLRICVMGCIGSGKTTISKYIAKELGLFHIDFVELINKCLIPRHFKKIGRQYENSFTDPSPEEENTVQIDEENLEADLLSNEMEFRAMLNNYFEQGQPFLSTLLQKLLKKLWFQEPFLSTGFVLDGFPRMLTDIEEMVACYCIPDLIVDVSSNSDVALERMAPLMFKTWKAQMTEAKNIVKTNFEKEKSEWLSFVTQKVVCKLLLEEIVNGAIGDVEPAKLPSTESYKMEMDAQDSDLTTVYNEIVQEYPEPFDLSTWEKPADARERIEASRVPVPDERYEFLCEYHKPASKVPAFLNVVDIAGLVKGAAEGQGLGNAFLSHIKACDAIFNLCRAFDDEDVIHVDGEVNPVRDLETIGEELRLKDEEQLMASLDKLERTVGRGGDKKLKPEYDALLRIKAVLVDEKKHIRFGDWSAADIEVLNRYLFITSKPALYLVNLSEKDYIRKKNKWLPKLKEWIDKNDPGAPLIPFSGALETKLMDMEPAERQAYLKENGITSALDKIIVQGYKALQLEYFFTAGADEVKAWIIQKGTKAPQAAGRIHTDFEKGFIMAEVMHYKDFKEEGSEAACKSAGKYRQQGRNYVVEDGDIIFFKFNAGAGIKDAKKK